MKKINQFTEKNPVRQTEMDKKLESLKLERIMSLWYFVSSTSKAAIAGSKG